MRRVAVETLKKSDFKRTTTQPGTVQAAESAEVYPRASGFIKNVTVDIGGRRAPIGQLAGRRSSDERDLDMQKGLALEQRRGYSRHVLNPRSADRCGGMATLKSGRVGSRAGSSSEPR